VPAAQHHAFAAARAERKRQDSDPFVRTSMWFRRSDLTYMRTTYGTAVAQLRRWIALDRGISASRMARHVGAGPPLPRGASGKFLPKTAASLIDATKGVIFDDPHVPPAELPARERVIEAFEQTLPSHSAPFGTDRSTAGAFGAAGSGQLDEYLKTADDDDDELAL
jgi:hypothetical protein